MKCKKCGYTNYNDSKFCKQCGCSLIPQGEAAAVPRKKTSVRKLIIVIVSVILLIALGITAVLLVSGNPNRRIENYLVSGQKYLIEMDYEQAIVEFDKIIAIDPNNAYAYLGKAEALFALGKDDEAIETLNIGYSLTKDDTIAEELGLNDNSSAVTSTTTDEKTTTTTSNDDVSEPVVEVLPAPDGVTYSSDSNSITLQWEAVDGAFAYKILVCDEFSDEFEEYKTVRDLSAKVTDLKPSSEYQIRITTMTLQNGPLREEETTDILYCKTKEEIKLSAPTNVQCDSDDHSITLKWNKVDGADAYKIWKHNSETNEFEVYTVVITDSCLVDGLNAETEYEFKITTMTTINGVKEHNTTDIISCTTKEKELLRYVDVSAYFNTSDVLYGVADGEVINVQGATEWDDPIRSVYVSDSLKCTKLDEVFPDGVYSTDSHYVGSWENAELVHNSGTQHVYKATENGVKIIKTSLYPMYVTQDGYIAYYKTRGSNYVVVNIESPTGEIISSTTIYDYIDPVYIGYGAVKDRLEIYNGSKGVLFRYTLYISDIGSRNEDVYYNYLFYDSGEVLLERKLYGSSNSDSFSLPDELFYSGETYLYGQVESQYGNVIIAEYYHSDFNPWEYIDFYIDPAYAAYAVVNINTGKTSKLYKSIESVDGKLFLVTDFNGNKGYINSNGIELAIGYSDAGNFIGEYSYVKQNGIYYIIDRQMNVISEVDGTSVYVLGGNRFSCVRGNKVYLLEVNE